MAWYYVRLHGSGIAFAMGDATATGFYTSRSVRAESAEEAVEKAKAQVMGEWAKPKYTKHNKGAAPLLNTEEVREISFWQSLSIPNKGHTFYAPDAASSDANSALLPDTFTSPLRARCGAAKRER